MSNDLNSTIKVSTINQTMEKSTSNNNMVGKQAISTIDFNTWLDEPVKQPVTKKKRVRAIKEIIYPIFVSCANLIEDPFWKTLFHEASVGKFPTKFGYNGKRLIFKPKRICIELATEDIKKTSEDCMEFFRVHGNIFSSLDEHKSAEYREFLSKQEIEMTWEKANKKLQECLISYYVMDQKEKRNLNTKETSQLRQTILLAFCGKYIGKHNIHVEDMRITKIDPLLYNTEERKYYIDPKTKPNIPRQTKKNSTTKPITSDNEFVGNSSTVSKEHIPQYNIKWKKYIKSLAESSAKHATRMEEIEN